MQKNYLRLFTLSRFIPAHLLGWVFAVLLTSTVSYAQDDATNPTSSGPEADEEIVVSGIRASFLSAQQQKRNADNIIDAITLEDIGKYTDQNLAETLQRVPGVQISFNDSGEGDFISIRGLGPAFNHITSNGRTALGSANITNGMRAFSMDNVLPELSAGARVAKSPTADMDEGGIGGNIDITTARPLTFKKGRMRDGFFFAASLDEVYNAETERADPRVSGLVNWQASDSFGMLLGLGFSDRTTISQIARLVQTDKDDSVGGIDNVLRPGTTAQYQMNDGDVKKYGIGFTAQYRPSDELDIILDIGRNQQITQRQQNNIQFGSNNKNSNQVDNEAAVVLETPNFPDIGGILIAGRIDEGTNIAGGSSRGGGNATRTKFDRVDQMIGLHTQWQPDMGSWIFDFDLSHAESEFSRLNRIITLNYTDIPDGYTWRTDVEGVPLFNFVPNSKTGQPYVPKEGNVTLNRLGFNIGNVQREEDAFQFDLDFELNWGEDVFTISTLEAGIKLRELSTEQIWNTSYRAKNAQRNTALSENGINSADVPPLSTYIRDIPLPSGGFLSEIGAIPPTERDWFALNNKAVFDYWWPILSNSSVAPPEGYFDLTPAEGNTRRFFDGKEDITALYVKANFEGMFGTIGYRGNFGIRQVNTDVVGKGFRILPDSVSTEDDTLKTETGKYDDLLPSFNIAFELMDELQVRFAASEVMTRPDINRISGPTRVNENTKTSIVTVDLINPDLEPFRATQYEAIAEWYPGEEGMSFALGYFVKDIETFPTIVTSEHDRFTVDGFELVAADFGTGYVIQVNDPQNVEDGAEITGAEFSTHIPFNAFTEIPILRGFGFKGSYTRLFDNDSEETDLITGKKLPLPGASENNYSITLYYDEGDFSWRTSYTYRGRNLNAASSFGGSLYDEENESLSTNFNYDFTENFSMRFQLNNMLEEPRRQTFAEGLFPYSYSQSGRSYTLGVRYSY